MEPYRLRQQKLPAHCSGRLFTCARPGRSKGSKAKVSDVVIREWLRGLPAGDIILVSLLGRKPDTRSEWSFYTFHEQGITFQSWLDRERGARSIAIIEHPTTDMKTIQADMLEKVSRDVLRNLAAGKTVVLMDSGGYTRVRQVCKLLERKLQD
jgi:hypothetical protein